MCPPKLVIIRRGRIPQLLDGPGRRRALHQHQRQRDRGDGLGTLQPRKAVLQEHLRLLQSVRVRITLDPDLVQSDDGFRRDLADVLFGAPRGLGGSGGELGVRREGAEAAVVFLAELDPALDVLDELRVYVEVGLGLGQGLEDHDGALVAAQHLVLAEGVVHFAVREDRLDLNGGIYC